MALTSDPNDPRLSHGPDKDEVSQAEAYLVLSDKDRAQGFVRPVRDAYWHVTCGHITTMARALAETYATEPSFYGSTYCTYCRKHLPVGPGGEFYWYEHDGSMVHKVGT